MMDVVAMIDGTMKVFEVKDKLEAEQKIEQIKIVFPTAICSIENEKLRKECLQELPKKMKVTTNTGGLMEIRHTEGKVYADTESSLNFKKALREHQSRKKNVVETSDENANGFETFALVLVIVVIICALAYKLFI